MFQPVSKTSLTRRRVLAIGGRVAGGFVAAAALGGPAVARTGTSTTLSHFPARETTHAIEQIIGAQGTVSNGVFSIEVDRNDITNVTLHGVPVTPAFQINGMLNFQDIGGGRSAMNSDLALKANEIDPFIDQLLAHRIVFQAEHQHFYDFSPMVWFIHFRAVGDPLEIARGIKAALNVTSTPFPQTLPANPKTPLPAGEIGKILGGTATVGSNGVVSVNIPREDPIVLGGIRINPFLNVASAIAFQPYGGGQDAAAAPDFGMVASEIQNVVGVMRAQGWDIGCLYNQETDEHPQLYFSHQFKTGNAIELAHEIRAGLNRTDSKFMT